MVYSIRRTVVKVIDGDTVQVARKIDGSNFVRLSGVNAPEKNQPGGKKATNILSGMIGGETVTMRPEARDKYGRIVATIIFNRENINKKLKKKLQKLK
jgi:endonuclease YncB( thermonuclease family)